MNTPSRSSNASGRAKRPDRPLPSLPAAHEAKKQFPQLSQLVKDDIYEPFQLLESHPLSLICKYHNVKRVSLEEGVPPPLKFDVPMLRGSIQDPNAFLPTHVLAVYDQDNAREQAEHNPSLSPHSADSPSGRSSLPATPVLIPVNADLWAVHFTATLPADPNPSSTPSFPSIDAKRKHSSADSTVLKSSQPTNRHSLIASRPRSVLSLPVYVVRVPSAKALPLLLLATLRIVPHNHILPALLPRRVLAELPAPPVVLAQHLLHWLHSVRGGRGRRSLDSLTRSPPFRATLMPADVSISRSPRLLPSPLFSPSFSPDSDALKRFSSASSSSLLSVHSSTSSLPSTSSPRSDYMSESICALADPATLDDPVLCLLNLAQQNFGLWADALALGVRDPAVVHLVELAWTVASEARRARFDIGDQFSAFDIDNDADTGGRSAHASLRGFRSRSSRSRSRAPTPFLDAPPTSSSSKSS